jgi:dihydrofolate reductase
MLSLIAAMAMNRVIGDRGRIPWHIAREQQLFKQLTLGHPVIMGRGTYQSIGHPLEGRLNIVVSRNPDYRVPGCLVAPSLAAALQLCAPGVEEVFVLGGTELFEEALPRADRVYLSLLHRVVEGDTYFPELPVGQFRQVLAREYPEPEPFTFFLYEREAGGRNESDRSDG